jgi:hypothetical protein
MTATAVLLGAGQGLEANYITNVALKCVVKVGDVTSGGWIEACEGRQGVVFDSLPDNILSTKQCCRRAEHVH